MSNHSIINALTEELEIEVGQDPISEEELLEAISFRVGRLMDTDSGLLFSYLYRLDVSEKSLNSVINSKSEDPLPLRIAQLILERQKERIKTKKEIETGDVPEGWEW